MIRKYHNHKQQTTPWHREEEPLNHHETPGRHLIRVGNSIWHKWVKLGDFNKKNSRLRKTHEKLHNMQRVNQDLIKFWRLRTWYFVCGTISSAKLSLH